MKLLKKIQKFNLLNQGKEFCIVEKFITVLS